MFPCVSLQVSLNLFRVLNYFGFTAMMTSVLYKIKFFIRSFVALLLPCGNVFRYDVAVLGSNLAEPMYFFLSFFLLQLSL